MLKGEGLVNYRGHGNRVMCVEWSPVDPDVVWTGADDFTVHEWRLSKQEFTAPPKGEEKDCSLVSEGVKKSLLKTVKLTSSTSSSSGKKMVALREKNKQKKNNMAACGQREGESPPVGEREASERGTRGLDGERETKAVNGETEIKAVNGERGWRERDPKRVNGERETVSVNRERETKTVNGERGWRERDIRSVNGERDEDEQNGTNGSSLSTGTHPRTNTNTHTRQC